MGIVATVVAACAQPTQADVPVFVGYETPLAANTPWYLPPAGSSVTRELNGTNGVPGLSGSYFGLMHPSPTSGGIDGLPYNTGGPRTQMDMTTGLGSGTTPWPGGTFFYQQFFYLDNRVQAAPGNISNESFWLNIFHGRDTGTIGTAGAADSYRFRRTSSHVSAGTWDITLAGGPGMSAPGVAGDNWYGIVEEYSQAAFGTVKGYIVDDTGVILASMTRLYNTFPASEFTGFLVNTHNRFDADAAGNATSIQQLGLPMDNTATVMGSLVIDVPNNRITNLLIPALTVPEPVSGVLLGLGGVFMLRRRRAAA